MSLILIIIQHTIQTCSERVSWCLGLEISFWPWQPLKDSLSIYCHHSEVNTQKILGKNTSPLQVDLFKLSFFFWVCAMNFCVLLCCCILLLWSGNVSSLNCYIDSKGIPEPGIGDVVDKTAFKTLQCNILKEDPEKVLQQYDDTIYYNYHSV